MSYQSATIQSLIGDIDHNKVYLPALQRKFVWRKRQIESLFDSLMRNYPIGTFLFWRIHRRKADDFVFYEFLKEYDEREPFNRRKTGAFTHEEIVGVLDGQQRLSAMYLGLMGSHTEKAPYKRRSNSAAYEKTVLYLNLLSVPLTVAEGKLVELEDRDYEFQFLTAQDAASTERPVKSESGAVLRQESVLWMKVGDVLNWDSDLDLDGLMNQYADDCETEGQRIALNSNSRIVRRCLDLLHKRICGEKLVNYFEVAKDDLEDILKIFVRVNSGGTVLNKTDLLFSTIVATWDDGREQIEALLKNINSKGDKFSFGNEFLMRCCLVLTDGPVVYRVNSFKSENVQRIRDEWPRIATAIVNTVDLLVEFGFNGELLTSQNATIPIAYYLHKGGARDDESKQALRRYLVHALLNRIFSGSQDQLIVAFRNAFRIEVKTVGAPSTFHRRFEKLTFQEILDVPLPAQKSLLVTESDLDRFLGYAKGPDAFHVLTLLYPHLRFADAVFHQDHMHPQSGFSDLALAKLQVPRDRWPEWYRSRDTVPNLQLLAGRRNSSKNDTALAPWMNVMSSGDRDSFTRENYFPRDVSLEFSDFLTFVEKRREVLRNALREKLALAPVGSPSQLVDVEDLGNDVDADVDGRSNT